jgi:hypothetical protein
MLPLLLQCKELQHITTTYTQLTLMLVTTPLNACMHTHDSHLLPATCLQELTRCSDLSTPYSSSSSSYHQTASIPTPCSVTLLLLLLPLLLTLPLVLSSPSAVPPRCDTSDLVATMSDMPCICICSFQSVGSSSSPVPVAAPAAPGPAVPAAAAVIPRTCLQMHLTCLQQLAWLLHQAAVPSPIVPESLPIPHLPLFTPKLCCCCYGCC